MRLTGYLGPLDRRAVLVHWLAVLPLLGALLVVPLGASIVYREFTLSLIFAGLIAGTFAVGSLRHLLQAGSLETREALIVAALAYLTFSSLGSIPLLVAMPPLDAAFESMSAITTTGLSLLEPALCPRSLLFFRAYQQWVGGAGILILSSATLIGIGIAPGKNARELFGTEFGGGDLLGNVRATARIVLRIYLVLTAAGFAVYLACGMGPEDALLHVLATLSTGGFGPHRDSVGHFASPWLHAAVVAGMLLGATSFPLFHRLRRRGWRRLAADPQLRTLLALTAAGAAVITADGLAGPSSASSPLSAVFHAAAAVTTTGFSLTDPASWPPGTRWMVVLLMVMGGSAGSTAGGLKLWRVVLLVRTVRVLLLKASLPREAEVPLRWQGDAVRGGEQTALLALATLYLGTLGTSTLILTLGGFDAGDALFESASALGTVGLSVGVTSPDLAPWLKLTLMADMWAGRLEILPVVLLVNPRTWR